MLTLAYLGMQWVNLNWPWLNNLVPVHLSITTALRMYLVYKNAIKERSAIKKNPTLCINRFMPKACKTSKLKYAIMF